MLKLGDVVVRMLAGTIEMPMKVTEITDDKIFCTEYEFDRKSGAEIDDFLGWGPTMTGSFLRKKDGEFEVR